MKELDVFRYLKKYRTIIASASILAGIAFSLIAQMRIQQYSAATVIEYTGSRASEGLSPDGKRIDTSEIYTANIITQALKNIGVDDMGTVEAIRRNIRVEPVIAEEDLLVQKSKIDNGEDDYELKPTRYIVSFGCGVENGKEYPRSVLNQILQEYATYYGKTHVNTSLAANPVSDIVSKGYDYLEMAEVIDSTLEGLIEDLSAKTGWNGQFRSSRTGYCFQDLKNEFDFIRQVEVKRLFSWILSDYITKDRDMLLDKYRNRNNNLRISNNALSFELEKIRGIIGSYESAIGKFDEYDQSDFSGEGRENGWYNYVLPDVYDEWRRNQEDGQSAPVDRTTEYDLLLMKHIEDRTLYEYNLIDEDYNNFVISVFRYAPLYSSEELQQGVMGEISRVAEKINALLAVYYETNDEYNEYLGAQNIMLLSSVRITERFPVKLFTVLIIMIFGVLGCVGAVLFGRIEDFIEYYAFTGKVDNLPNRAKCDRFIALRENRPLSEQFACIVFKIANLKAENARLGRNFGDKMIKDFAKILTSVFPPSDRLFLGNNGAGLYLIFAENMGKEQVDAALLQTDLLLKQKTEEYGYRIELQYGFACANEEKCYYIRKLLAIAMARVGAKDSNTEKKA